ncbi:Tetratricopeptide-like helical domain containing protein [Parasponia andersonii]|uniref:Tetratricopeptide-like helical domain containing protein n=1 Tax=Parasponia andersonii TaxID=3476 RepID=A0A2P5ANQ9_PARAD|nr:Tetratricopeptide-like helical domain containing protein [Parasponia andersonii]
MLFSTSHIDHARKLIQTLSVHLVKPLSTATTAFIQQNHASQTQTLPNLRPFNSKISSYMRHGLVDEAQKLFDKMPQRNTVTWNSMVRGYFLNGYVENALSFFGRMPERDVVSYNTVIAGLMQCGDVDGARRLFDEMGFRDVVSWNSMVSGYIRNGMVCEAIKVFDEMPVKDVVSWNLVIGGLVNYGEFEMAEEYFRGMTTRDVVSWTIMISGLASAGLIVEARELFDEMPSRDTQAWNAMMVGYIENRFIEIAEDLFGRMPQRNFDSWNELVNGLVKSGRAYDGMKLFMQMPEKCRKTWNSILLEFTRNGLIREAHAFMEKKPYSDVVSRTNIILGYFEIGDVDSAIGLFNLMPIRDATAYNVTIFGLGENDRGEGGIKLFVRMKELGVLPDEATYTSVLTICSDLPALQLGMQTHAMVTKTGFNTFVAVCNAIVTMYARCGNVDSALLEFKSMPSQDIISWNSIICGFAHHGNVKNALEMFQKMRSRDVEPNHITFVGVLSACSHAGMVDLGRYYFDIMRQEYFIQPTSEHYTCLVDLLGRFGLLDEAMELLNQMRVDGIEVPASVWGALLGACRIHMNIEIGKIAGEKVLETEPSNSGVYLILAEMYLSCGRRKEAEMIWTRMKDAGVKKQPGCSWIELNNSSHVFLSGDCSNPEFSRINLVLELLHTEEKTKNSKLVATPLQQV